MYVVINDNTQSLERWVKSLSPESVLTFSHPNRAVMALEKERFEITCFIVDRFYYGMDCLDDGSVKKLRRMFPAANFIASSASFDEKSPQKSALKHFDIYIGERSLSTCEIKKCLEG